MEREIRSGMMENKGGHQMRRGLLPEPAADSSCSKDPSSNSRCSSTSFRSPTCFKRQARESCVTFRLENPEYAAPLEDTECWRGCKQSFSSWGNAVVPPVQRVPFNPMEIGAHMGLYSPTNGNHFPGTQAVVNLQEIGFGGLPGFGQGHGGGPRESLAGSQYLASRPVRFSNLWNSPSEVVAGTGVEDPQQRRLSHVHRTSTEVFSPARGGHVRASSLRPSSPVGHQQKQHGNFGYTLGDARPSNPDPMDEFGSSYPVHNFGKPHITRSSTGRASPEGHHRHHHHHRQSSRDLRESRSWAHPSDSSRESSAALRSKHSDDPNSWPSTGNTATCNSLCGHHSMGTQNRTSCMASCMVDTARVLSNQPTAQLVSQSGTPFTERTRSSPAQQQGHRHSMGEDRPCDNLTTASRHIKAATEYLADLVKQLQMDYDRDSPLAQKERTKLNQIVNMLAVAEEMVENSNLCSHRASQTGVDPEMLTQSFRNRDADDYDDSPDSQQHYAYQEAGATSKSSGGGAAEVLMSSMSQRTRVGPQQVVRGVRFDDLPRCTRSGESIANSFSAASSAEDVSASFSTCDQKTLAPGARGAQSLPILEVPLQIQESSSSAADELRDTSRKNSVPMQQTDSDMYNEFPQVSIPYGTVNHRESVREETRKRVAQLNDEQECAKALNADHAQGSGLYMQILSDMQQVIHPEETQALIGKSSEQQLQKANLAKKHKWDEPTSAQSSGTRTEQTISPHIVADGAGKRRYFAKEFQRFMAVMEQWSQSEFAKEAKQGEAVSPSGNNPPDNGEANREASDREADHGSFASPDNPEGSNQSPGDSDPSSRNDDKLINQNEANASKERSITSLLRESLEAALGNTEDETVFLPPVNEAVDNVVMLLHHLNLASENPQDYSDSDEDEEEVEAHKAAEPNECLRSSLAAALEDPFREGNFEEPILESALNAAMLLENLEKAAADEDDFSQTTGRGREQMHADMKTFLADKEKEYDEDDESMQDRIETLGYKLKKTLMDMKRGHANSTSLELSAGDLKTLLDMIEFEPGDEAAIDDIYTSNPSSIHGPGRTASGAKDPYDWSGSPYERPTEHDELSFSTGFATTGSSPTPARSASAAAPVRMSPSASSVVNKLLGGWVEGNPSSRQDLGSQEVSLNLFGVRFLVEALANHLEERADEEEVTSSDHLTNLLATLKSIERNAVEDGASAKDNIFTIRVLTRSQSDMANDESGKASFSYVTSQNAVAATLPPLKEEEEKEILTSWEASGRRQGLEDASPMLTKLEMPSSHHTSDFVIASAADSKVQSPDNSRSSQYKMAGLESPLASNSIFPPKISLEVEQEGTETPIANQEEIVFQFGVEPRQANGISPEEPPAYSPVFGLISDRGSPGVGSKGPSSLADSTPPSPHMRSWSSVMMGLQQPAELEEQPVPEMETMAKKAGDTSVQAPSTLGVPAGVQGHWDTYVDEPQVETTYKAAAADHDNVTMSPAINEGPSQQDLNLESAKPQVLDPRSDLQSPLPAKLEVGSNLEIGELIQSLKKDKTPTCPAGLEPCTNCGELESALPDVQLEEARLEKASSLHQESQFPLEDMTDQVERGLVLPSMKEPEDTRPIDSESRDAFDASSLKQVKAVIENQFRPDDDETQSIEAQLQDGAVPNLEMERSSQSGSAALAEAEQLILGPSKVASTVDSNEDFMVAPLTRIPGYQFIEPDPESDMDEEANETPAEGEVSGNIRNLYAPVTTSDEEEEELDLSSWLTTPFFNASGLPRVQRDAASVSSSEEWIQTRPYEKFEAQASQNTYDTIEQDDDVPEMDALMVIDKAGISPVSPHHSEPIIQREDGENMDGNAVLPTTSSLALLGIGKMEPRTPDSEFSLLTPEDVTALRLNLSLGRTSSTELTMSDIQLNDETVSGMDVTPRNYKNIYAPISTSDEEDEEPDLSSILTTSFINFSSMPSHPLREPGDVSRSSSLESTPAERAQALPSTSSQALLGIGKAGVQGIPQESNISQLSPKELANQKVGQFSLNRTSSTELKLGVTEGTTSGIEQDMKLLDQIAEDSEDRIELPTTSSHALLGEAKAMEPKIPMPEFSQLTVDYVSSLQMHGMSLGRSSSAQLAGLGVIDEPKSPQSPQKGLTPQGTEDSEDVSSIQTLSDPNVLANAESRRNLHEQKTLDLTNLGMVSESSPNQLAEAYGIKEEETTFASWTAERPEMAEPVNEKVLLVARAIFHHLKCLKSNTFSMPEATIKNGQLNSVETNDFVRAVAPTTSLFNHSCCPNSAWDFVDGKMVCRVLRPIKKGEEVTVSYGYNFHNYPKDERRRALRDTYCFDCECEACVNDYPTLDKSYGRPLVMKCPQCDEPELSHSGKCDKCGCDARPWMERLDQSQIEYLAKYSTLNKDNFQDAIPVLERHIANLDPLVPRDAVEYIVPMEMLRKCYLLQGYVHERNSSCRQGE